jgi:hypothetical protein
MMPAAPRPIRIPAAALRTRCYYRTRR